MSSPRVLVGVEFDDKRGGIMSGVFNGVIGLVHLPAAAVGQAGCALRHTAGAVCAYRRVQQG